MLHLFNRLSKKKPAYTGLILHLYFTYTCLYSTYLTDCQKKPLIQVLFYTYILLIHAYILLILQIVEKKPAYIGLILHLYSTYACLYSTYLTDCHETNSSYITLIFYLYLLIFHLLIPAYIPLILSYIPLILSYIPLILPYVAIV